ncbi:MAG: hypothetical protein EPO40_37055 [Myxococcaceae bacterium]|nr:MAG: hypothetical protein EPO40_37055 [Myxococcaceae bacterium]
MRNECLPRAARLFALAAALWASPAIAQLAPPTTGIDRGGDPYMARIRDGIDARSAAFRRCFELALRLDPALVARTDVMRFRVLPGGRVRAISVRVAPRSPALERCMIGVLERMVLPPHRGRPIEVTLPMNSDR